MMASTSGTCWNAAYKSQRNEYKSQRNEDMEEQVNREADTSCVG
jgi:hypothetical protein